MPKRGLRAPLLSYVRQKLPNRILCQRIFKCTFNSTIALIFCLNHDIVKVLGDEPAMLPLLSVMVHPGRRLGTMIEAVFFCSSGLLIGNSYALLGRFVAQKILGEKWYLSDLQQLEENYVNYRAALAVLALFEMFMLFYHGWMRSITHKFFGIVFPLFLVVHFTFTDNLRKDAGTVCKSFTVPFFMGIALSLCCNLLIFPEFGSSYLGKSMVYTLNELYDSLDSTVKYFISLESDGADVPSEKPTLAQVTKKKAKLREKLNSTQAVLQECIYEISYSYTSPTQLKGIITILKDQTSNINALINACQLQFSNNLEREQNPSSSKDVAKKIIDRTKSPIIELQNAISQSLRIVKETVAYCYDVHQSDTNESEIEREKVDLNSVDFDKSINDLAKAIADFEVTIRKELGELNSEVEDYLSPNDDMFVLSSFLMNLKENANSVCNMLKESKTIYEYRISREKKRLFGRKIWFSFLTNVDQLKGWFVANSNDYIASNETSSLNGDIHSRVFSGDDEETKFAKGNNLMNLDGTAQVNEKKVGSLDKIVVSAATFYSDFQPHFRFGFQIMVGLMIASFPMFIPESRHWYYELRGTWIGFVCILVLEPEVGSTFFVFFLRGVGVISGAAWGYLSYVAGIHQTNTYLEVVITVLGAIPGYYFFLGTPYIKAAIIGIISIYIVLLSSALPSEIGGSILVNFGKRCLAMIYGGVVALFCQLLFFPIKARDELTKEVGFSTEAISKLLLLYASGLDGEDLRTPLSPRRFEAFKKLSQATKSSLIRADAYKKSSNKEPRLKGSYAEIEKIFTEIIFILREILDRLDNIIQLRRLYGSAIIEEFNAEVYPYRRQLCASMSNSLKIVNLALLTKSPLPQYLPSARVSQKRLVQQVKLILRERYSRDDEDKSSLASESEEDDSELFVNFKKRRETKRKSSVEKQFLKAKFLSWNATSAATEEIIQYIEELLELCKVLVGVHEFKYGFLSRSLYSDYAAKAVRGYTHVVNEVDAADLTQSESDAQSLATFNSGEMNPIELVESRRSNSSVISRGFRNRVYSIGSWIRGDETSSTGPYGESSDDDEELPLSLMRVVSKKAKQND